MAEEQIVTNIVAKSDFSNLIADLNKVSSALTNLQTKLNATNKNLSSQINVMNRSFAETMRSTGQFSTHFVSLASDVDKFGTQLDKGQIKLKQFAQIYQTHIKTSGGLVRDLARQQVQLQNAILQPLGKNAEGLMQYNVHIPAGLDKVKNKTALARQELQIMNKVVQEGANQLINWGKNTQWAGRQLTVGLTLPLAAFGKASADAFRQADQELTRLTKVYGGIAATSSQELGKVRQDVAKTAAELSKSYGSSFKDTIALAADIAATGKQGNELLGSIKETTRLAVLGEVDRQDAMKATLAIQTAFKQNTEQLSESINFLNAVENQTSTTLNDLVEAIPKAGPIIQGLGGDVKDLALYLTAMREGGISASEGANALKSGLASLINPTKVAQDMFNGFGISLKSIVEKNAGNTTATILELQKALETLNPLQKQQALEQLFGKFQFARMNALFENLGKQGSQTLQVMDLMKASSQDLANIAGRELSMVTESASGKYRRALEGLKADLAGVGEQFLNINTHLINIVDGILKFVNKLPGPVKTVLGLFGGLTALAGPMIMLTGVLGNFFGYIIKGVSHMRALTKGGEGWKLLTPEILAANKAGGLVEQTFYSDAKAADILNTAINRLSASYERLAADANNAVISTNPMISTPGGSILMTGKHERIADPSHPLIGPFGSRAAAHHNPRGELNQLQRSQQTIHSFTPQPELVNQAIGKNPQIFSYGNMPNIPGLTTIGGASTGIVAGEATKWHTLMATLSMQTKQEVAQLEREIARTGTVSQEFMSTYSQILPAMTAVVDTAVAKSQQIIQKVQLGEMQVDQARAKIIAINAQLEADMITTSNQMAAQMSRTANLTGLPLTGQAIVDKTGKSNVREMFRDDRRVNRIISAIARATGVRTSGGGYSIETTIPKKLNSGGYIYTANDGSIVPGPNINADVVPAMLTPGEFVVNAKATRANLPLLQAINGAGSNGPGYLEGSNGPVEPQPYLSTARGSARPMIPKNIIDRLFPGRLTDRASQTYYEPKGNAGIFGGDVSGRTFSATTSKINKDMEGEGVDPRILLASINSRGGGPRLSTDVFLDGLLNAGVINKEEKRRLSKNIFKEYARSILSMERVNDRNNPVWSISNRILSQHFASNPIAQSAWQKYSRSPGSFAHPTRRSSTGWLNKMDINGTTINFANLEASGQNKFYHSKELANPFVSTINELINPSRTPITRQTNRLLRPMVGQKNPLGPGNFNPAVLGPNPALYAIEAHGRNTFLGDIVRKVGKQWHTPYALAMGAGRSRYTYTRTANRGGLIGLNRGGRVPGYNTGGGPIPVTTTPRILFGNEPSYSLGSMEQPQTSTPGLGKMIGSGLAQNAIFMGGMAGGSALGGKFGGGLGALAGSMLGPTLLQATLTKLGAINKAGASSASIFGRLGPILSNPYVMAGTAIVGVTAVLMNLKKNIEQTAKINRLAFSGGVKPIKDFDSQIKQAVTNIENAKAAAELLHSQLNSAGVSGLTLTIKQFADLREKVKSNYPELVKLFKQTPSNNLTKVAAGLKAQFVAAGESASQANAKIAALLAESGKSGFIRLVLGDQGLKDITSSKTAIEAMLKAMSKLTSTKDRTASMLQIFTSMSDQLDKSTDKSKTLKEQFDAVAKSGQDNVKITQEQIVEISKTNPELANILNTTDDIGTALAKWRIVVGGVNKDLSGLNKGELEKFALAVEAVTEKYNKLLDVSSKEAQNNKVTGNLAKDIFTFEKQQAAVQKNVIDNIESQISLKDKQIAQIKKEADARKKALQDQQQIEDVKLQIQQEQLNYQNALASGDMATAAQAQINIQRLVGQQQLKSAETAIDDAAQKKIDALQAQIDVLNKKVGVANNAERQPAKSPLRPMYEGIQAVYRDLAVGNISQEEALTRFNDLVAKLERTKDGKKYLKDLGVTGSVNNLTREDNQTTVGKIDTNTSAGAELLTALQKGSNDIAGQQLAVLREIRDKIGPQGPGKTYTPPKTGGTGGETPGQQSDAGGTSASGTIENYTATATSIKSAALKAVTSKTAYALDNGQTYKLFKYKDKSYAVHASNGLVYEWDTNKNLRGKTLIGDASKKADFASGGPVFGAGTSTSDSIPAMLSNGEYVINAASVRAIGTPTLDRINRMAAGGIATKYDIPRMSTGGRINYQNGSNGGVGPSNSLYNINVTLNGSNLTADDVARSIHKEMQRREIVAGRSRTI